MSETYTQLNPSIRTLLGPGPSNCHPRVLRAISMPPVGYLDPDCLGFLDDVKELLQFVFQTKNELTLAVSGTGGAGMETCLSNVIEPGDNVVACVNGFFGERLCDIAERSGGNVIRIDGEWGRIIEPGQIKEAMTGKAIKAVAIVQAETSTGVCQPLKEISNIVHENGALLIADLVTSLGGCDLKIDELQIDACYSCTQKCIGAPPGMSPVSFSERAREVVRNRKTEVKNWYLDMSLVEKYWGEDRMYHHTIPINMIYAVREALLMIHEEGLGARFARHDLNHRALAAGLEAMDLEFISQEGHRLPMLNAVRIPDGVDDAAARKHLLNELNLEIGGGLGAFKGKAWRIGLMGYSSTKSNVLLCLGALEQALMKQGYEVPAGAGVAAANEVYGVYG